MNITIKQLKAFVAIAKSGSFAEACTRMNLSQPALSITIKNLEEVLGGKLLERSTRSVTLTPEGAEFFPVVQRLLADWDKSLEDVHNLFALRRGKLDIAAMPTFASSLLPAILAEYHRQYVDINVTVHDVIAESVVDMVREGRVELGVTFDPGDAQDLNFQPLFRDKFVAVLPQEHPLLKKERLRWRDSAELPLHLTAAPFEYPLADRPGTAGTQYSADTGIRSAPISQHRAHGDYRTGHKRGTRTEQWADARDGCAVPTAYSAPVITRNVGMITRKRQPLSLATEAMMAVIKQWVKDGHRGQYRFPRHGTFSSMVISSGSLVSR